MLDNGAQAAQSERTGKRGYGTAMEIVQCDGSHAQAWNAFVNASPRAALYHRFEWREVNASCFGHKSAYLAALDGAKVVGVFPIVRVKSQLFGNIACSLPFVNYGGPCGETDGIEQALVDAAKPVVDAWGVDYLEIRARRPVESLPTSEHKVSMTLDLNPDPEVLFKAFTSAHRQDIRGGYKKGLTAKIGGRELLGDFYSVLSESWRDMGTPIYSRRYLESVAATFPDITRLCVIYAGTEPAAASLDMLAGRHRGGPLARLPRQVSPPARGLRPLLGTDQKRVRARAEAIPPRAIDDAVGRGSVQEKVERVPHPVVLAVRAQNTARHPAAQRREPEVSVGDQDVAEAARAGHAGDRSADRSEHSVSHGRTASIRRSGWSAHPAEGCR